MKAYLPAFTKDWLDTNPPEGEKLFIAAVAFFADHWGVEVYQEWESLDIKNFNHTCKDFMVNKLLHNLKEAGVIETIRGLDEVESIRLAKSMTNGSRMIFGPSAIPFELSEHSSILWAYFLGRTADMLERSYSEDLMAPIEVKRKRYKVKPKPLPKVGSGRKRKPKDKEVQPMQHVIPHVYRSQFVNKTTTNK